MIAGETFFLANSAQKYSSEEKLVLIF